MRGLICGVVAVLAIFGPTALEGQDAAQALARADDHFQAERWTEASAEYEGILAADSTVAMAWYRLGRVRHAQGRDEEALELFRAAERNGFPPMYIRFSLARSLVALDRQEAALDELQTLATNGFTQTASVTDDPGLAPLAGEPRLAEILATMERNAAPCLHSEEARKFDFWEGRWQVYDPQSGQQQGVNVVERILNGCALMENWTGGGGSSGKSMNFYDPQRKTWRQVWVSDRANVLDYREGHFSDGAMRFSGITISPQGDTTLQKLTFHAVAEDTVRQVFEVSNDGGESWRTTWVGVYVRSPIP